MLVAHHSPLLQQNHVTMQLILDVLLGCLHQGFSIVQGANFEYKVDLVMPLLVPIIACHNEIWIVLHVLFRNILTCKDWLRRDECTVARQHTCGINNYITNIIQAIVTHFEPHPAIQHDW